MKTRLYPILLLSLVLAACSGGGSDPAPDTDGDSGTTDGTDAGGTTGGDATDGGTDGADGGGSDGNGTAQLGTVRIAVGSSGIVATTLNATFRAYSPALTTVALPDTFLPTEDTCEIAGDDSLPRDTTIESGLDITYHFAAGVAARQQIRDREAASQSQRISAGDTLVFTSPAGTFGELNRDSASFYQMTNGSILGDAPEGLIVTIPGDVFPAFGDVDMPVFQPFDVTDETPKTGTFVNSDSRLTWTPGDSSVSFIALYGQARNQDANPQIRTATIICVLPDDGEFELTAAQRQEIHTLLSTDSAEPDDFPAFWFERVSYRSVQSGDSVLILQSTTRGNQ